MYQKKDEDLKKSCLCICENTDSIQQDFKKLAT